MPTKAKHLNRRQSQLWKHLWVVGAAGTVCTAASAMGQGEWNQNISAEALFAGSSHYQFFPELESIQLKSATPVRLLDNLLLDAELGAVSPSLTLGQYYSLLPGFSGDGNGTEVANGSGWGGIGIIWNIARNQHLALSFQSPMDVDYGGHFGADSLSSLEPAAVSSGFNSAVGMPAIFAISYGIALTETISLESDFQWLDFSRAKAAASSTEGNAAILSLANRSGSQGQSWTRNIASGFTADWKFAEHWILRAGYQFFENPVHSSAFSPTIPDVNQHVFTLGVGWKGKESSLELAYAMDFYYDRHIANDQQPGFDGAYGFDGHLLSLAYKFSF